MDKIQEHSLLAQNYPGIPATDGAGVKLTRLLGTPELDQIDPFLMLDRIDSDDPDSYIAGFPDHPHRGFETITYMLNGKFKHKDSAGNEGYLTDGSVQWMTAGKGVIHSEMPEQYKAQYMPQQYPNWKSQISSVTRDKQSQASKGRVI